MTVQKKEFSIKGFTLIELMVAISIIAILATIGLIVYSSAQRSARVTKRSQDLSAIKLALETFKITNGKYPAVVSVGAFVCLNTLTGTNSLVPSFMPTIPSDPQGTGYCYRYTSDGTGGLGGPPSANNFKVITDPSTPTSEMGSVDYRSQPNLIDPNRDETAGDNCAVQNTGSNAITGWAIYSTNNAACNW